jgi:hypothetical protein
MLKALGRSLTTNIKILFLPRSVPPRHNHPRYAAISLGVSRNPDRTFYALGHNPEDVPDTVMRE